MPSYIYILTYVMFILEIFNQTLALVSIFFVLQPVDQEFRWFLGASCLKIHASDTDWHKVVHVNPEWLLMPKQISILKIGKLRRVNKLPFVFGDHYIVHSGKKQLSIGAQIPIEHVLPECVMIPNHCTKKKNRWF